jgi:hypothetical protein
MPGFRSNPARYVRWARRAAKQAPLAAEVRAELGRYVR